MARPITAKFGKMQVRFRISNPGVTPVVMAAYCGLASKSISFSSNFAEVSIPDCDDPDAMIWLGRDKQSLTASISGDGVLASEAIKSYWEFFKSPDSRPVEVEIEYSTGTMIFTGLMHMENFNPTAEEGGRVAASISFQSDGELVGVWTDTP